MRSDARELFHCKFRVDVAPLAKMFQSSTKVPFTKDFAQRIDARRADDHSIWHARRNLFGLPKPHEHQERSEAGNENRAQFVKEGLIKSLACRQ